MKQGNTPSLPKGWEIKKLGEVCNQITDGSHFSPKSTEEGEYPYITVRDINDDAINFENCKFINKSDYQSLLKNGCKPNNGDLLFSKDGTVGKVSLVNFEKDFVVLSSLAIIRPKKDIILPELLVHILKNPHFLDEAIGMKTGVAIRRIILKNLKLIDIQFPKSLSEQQRIVAVLDEAFASIAKAKANAEQNFKNAKELFESYLQGVFDGSQADWELCTLETHIKLIDYRGRTPVKTESGIRLITAKNVKLGYLQLDPQEFIAENNYENWMSRGIPNLGDVIFTTEAPLANVAQIDTSDKLAFAQRIIVMQPKPTKLNQTFLKYMLLSNPIRNKILAKGTGATVLGIKSSLLKKIEIYFPKSIAEQQTIVRKLDALSAETKRLEGIYQQKINDLEELKKSVLQKAFSGELKTYSNVTL